MSEISRHRLTLRPTGRYHLPTAVVGHGWYQLAPHAWDPVRGVLATPLALSGGGAVVARIAQRSDRLTATIDAPRRLAGSDLAALRTALRRTLQLDIDLEPFWAAIRSAPSPLDLRWVEGGAAGYLMQSPTLFEDLLKILLTTNCSWAFTKIACARLVAALGAVAPGGLRAFPDAAACAAVDEAFWRDEIRIGYRAPHAVALARGFAGGALRADDFEDPALSAAELQRRLRALPGFGPYAVGHALRGLGRCRELAIDSWCRARATEICGLRRPPSDAWFARRVGAFAPFEGLALWFWLAGPGLIGAAPDAR